MLLFQLLEGCSPKSTPTPVTPERRDECRLATTLGAVPETLTVILADSVNPAHAPSPTDDSERLLFRQLFETLIRLDCQGDVRPGLATFWSADSSGRVWTFTLSGNARLPDGSPLTAGDVVSAWQAHQEGTRSMGILAAAALDQRRLAVTLSEPHDSVPHAVADPALAVAVKPSEGPPVFRFQMLANADPRDALDRGADLLVTRDPAQMDYVAGRPDFVTFPLPWSRTYVLLESPGAESVPGRFGADSARRSFARDAVRADARAAEPPFWWNDLTACVAGPAPRSRPTSSRVVYVRGDEVARGLAERIVGVASGGATLRTAALGTAEFAAALRDGSERGYIVALPRLTLARCRESAAWPGGATIEPLIDTRAQAIVRRGSPALTVDWDGTVRLLADDTTRAERP